MPLTAQVLVVQVVRIEKYKAKDDQHKQQIQQQQANVY